MNSARFDIADVILSLHGIALWCSIFCDSLPEDGEVSEELYIAFEALNKVIANHPQLSWSPGDKAAIVNLD